MASKGRMPSHHIRRPHPGPGVLHPDPNGPGMHPPPGPFSHFDLPRPEVMEQKLAVQHMEMQVLLTENQRLAATHGSLRQELAAAQNELQILQAQSSSVRAEKEQQVRSLTEKIERMGSELQAEDAIKADLEKARSEAQKLAIARQELMSKVQHLTHELQRVHADVQKIPFMMQELDSIRQELQHCRATYDYEKKLYNDHLESLQVMEKNYFNMSKEMEKLRAELSANTNRIPGGAYGGTTGYENHTPGSHPVGQSSYEDAYAAQHGLVALPGPAGGIDAPAAGPPSHFDGQHVQPPQRVGFYDQQRGPYDHQMQMGMYNHPQAGHPYDPQRAAVQDAQQGPPDAKVGPNVRPHVQGNNAAYGAAAAPAAGASLPRPGNPVRR